MFYCINISYSQIKPNYNLPQQSTNPNKRLTIQQQNRATMRRLGFTPPPTQADIQRDTEQKRKQLSQVISNKQKHRNYVYSIIAEDGKNKNSSDNSEKKYNGRYSHVKYNSEYYKNSLKYFDTAFSEISKMLEGNKKLDLKKAVFLMENVVMKDQISYAKFSQKIAKLKKFLKDMAKYEKLDITNTLASHYLIQKLFTDTLYDRNKKPFFHPFKYDFNDIFGNENPNQPLVSKLLYTKKGQCKSIPLLYSIMAQELNTESYLSFSPNHSYIKFKDKNGTWFNFETTNGMNTTNSWVVGSGFVKSEAIKNKIYTEPITTKQIVSHLLVELAMEYRLQFGFDKKYMNDLLDKSLQHFPNNIHAWIMKANLKTAEFERSLWKVGYPPIQQLSIYPEQQKLFDEMMNLYVKIDNLGFSKMPKEAYDEWLKTLEDKKNKQNNERFLKSIRVKITD